MRRLYVVYDLLAAAMIAAVMEFRHDAAAVRAFGDILSDPQSMLSKHPADFDLLCVGTVSETGLVVGFPEHEVVITGAAWKAAQQPDGPELVKEA